MWCVHMGKVQILNFPVLSCSFHCSELRSAMEVEEPLRLHPQSHALKVQGMERVVATVSGYHGSERFNLIKLISHAGANYVGSMSKSITHLVCWKFEGPKYDIAQKFGIYIVNHRWVEDCIKEGRRVPENHYILQSGHEVGPLLLEVPVTFQSSSLSKNKEVSDRLCDIGSEREITDLGSEACGFSVLEDSCLLEKYRESSSYSSRLSRKGKRKTGSEVRAVTRHPRKERRFVKNDVGEVVLDPIIDLTADDRVDRLQTEAAATSSISGAVSVNHIQENIEGCDAGLGSQSRTIDGDSDGIEQSREVPFPVAQTSVDLCSSAAEKFTDGDVVDNVDTLPTSNELSCAICFTGFSPTRGILPCGHRYCFSCIQRWVDLRTSMGKVSQCPLCKASITKIMKVEHAATTDQKIYSQTIPCDYPTSDVFILMDRELLDNNLEVGSCVVCRGLEPEDLLENCNVCRTQRIHSYCIDPPLRPWICSHCKELQMLYRNHSY